MLAETVIISQGHDGTMPTVDGWRCKIEVTFRTLVQLLGGLGDRFWLKAMTATPT